MVSNEATEDKTIGRHVGRMVTLQHELEQPRDGLNDVRREARADGLNVDALNALVPLITKYPHDKAAGVLNELIRYAEIFGAEIDASRTKAGTDRVSAPISGTEPAQSETSELRPAVASDRGAVADSPLRLSAEVLAAIGLTIGLIWLLN